MTWAGAGMTCCCPYPPPGDAIMFMFWFVCMFWLV
jgi:hypothetical protein